MTNYPEHEKLNEVINEWQKISEFLEWVAAHGYTLASCQHFGDPEPHGFDMLVASGKSTDQWLYEFFEIDPFALEKERSEMLKSYK